MPNLTGAIVAHHKQHPALTAPEIAKALGCAVTNVYAAKRRRRLGIPRASRGGLAAHAGLTDKIVAYHHRHPNLTAPEIAKALKTMTEFVRVVKARRGLAIPQAKPGRRA